MLSFILRRIARALLILASVELLVFLLVHSIPGNPWDTPENVFGARRGLTNLVIDTTTVARLKQHYGLDLPLWRQYTRYLIGDYDANGAFVCGLVCGNMGPSTRQGGRCVEDMLFSPPK